jgi:predicted MPP superfamily phosphohydrolase
MRTIIFFTIFAVVVLLLALMQVYIYRNISEWLDTFAFSARNRVLLNRALIGLMIYLNLAIPVRVFIRAFTGRDFYILKYLFVFPGATWFIAMMMMFFLFLMKDMTVWMMNLIQQDPVDLGRRAFLKTAGAVSVGAPLILTGYGALKTARDYTIERVTLDLPDLPSGLNGFTIAQVSDIHSGIYMTEQEMQKILEIVNSLHPQMAALTGDFVDSRAEEIAPVARVFSRIKTDYGVFGCMGNHDVFDNYAALSSAMKKSGILMLDNDNRVLRVNGEELNVLGVADSRFARLERAMQGIDPDAFKILLAHRPSFFPHAKQAGIDLQLSGHTHGGQIALDLAGIRVNLATLFHEYAQGLYGEGKSNLYVNSGVGMVFAPVRISVPPEITLITLQKA